MRDYDRLFKTSEALCKTKLKDNEHKGSWDNLGEHKEMNLAMLFALLDIEVKELNEALLFGTREQQASEATDVCNIAKMIQDVIVNRPEN